MRPSSPRRRAARALMLLAAGAAACLAAVWAGPCVGEAAAARAKAAPVELRSLRVPGGLAVLRDAAGDVERRTRVGASGPSDTTTASQAGIAASGVVTLDAGMCFSMVGLVCEVPTVDGAVTVRLRAGADGDSWGDWYTAPLERTDGSEGDVKAFIEPVWTGAARYVQVAAVAAAADAPVTLGGVRVVAIDPMGDASTATKATKALRRVATAAAGTDLTATTTADALAASPAARALKATAAASTGAPTIVTRAGWGADESLRKASPSYTTVKMAFVHHTAGGNTYTAEEAPAVVRAVYAYHTGSMGLNDIGYNFLIDRYGVIYEGRYGGMDRGVLGAQCLGFNTGSTGISIMGTFTSEEPPAAAIASLEQLLAWKLDLHGLDPEGTATMTCSTTNKYKAGASVDLPVISGHRDANYTACPGDQLYALLPAVRTAVAELIGSATPRITIGGVDSAWHAAAIDLTLIADLDPALPLVSMLYSLDEGSTWVDVPGTETTRTLTVATEGKTRVIAYLLDAGGRTASRSATVRIDSRKPATKAYAATVRKGRKVGLGFKVHDALPGSGKATVTLRIYKGTRLKKTLKAGVVASNAKKSFTWRATVAPGKYKIKVYAADLAGNAQSKVGTARLTVRR